MKILIIYKSITGFTKQYATWLSRELNCELEEIRNLKKISFNNYDLIIFGTRIHAGRIDGLNKIKKLNLDSKLIIFTTGATPKETNSIKEVWHHNLTTNELQVIKHFYFPAGINYEKMPLLDKMLMKFATSMLEKKENKSSEEIGMANSLKKSYDISNQKYLKPLLNYLKSL